METNTEKIDRKIEKLKALLRDIGSVIIAFSGGVDSSFLLNIAKNESGVNVIAVTANFPAFLESELKDSKKIAAALKCRHIIIDFKQLEIDELKNNPINRCYYCKRNLFLELIKIKNKYKFNSVIDGTNYDDLNTFRPGIKALKELEIKSPLADAGLTVEEIRKYSRKLNLPTWNKPSFSCILTRLPYNEKIFISSINKIKKAENSLRQMGFSKVRVRYNLRYNHPVARIELDREDIPRILDNNIREKVIKNLKSAGFSYIYLDLEDYRTGSMLNGSKLMEN
jgi:uncharacterized protein